MSLSTEMQFSTDLALMSTQPQRIKVDDATRTNDNRGISWCPDSCKGKRLNLVSLTNFFELLYPRLFWEKSSLEVETKNFKNVDMLTIQLTVLKQINHNLTLFHPPEGWGKGEYESPTKIQNNYPMKLNLLSIVKSHEKFFIKPFHTGNWPFHNF